MIIFNSNLPWNYEEKVKEFIKPDVTVLNIGDLDDEINHLIHNDLLTICNKIKLPFENGSFKLVLNKNKEYDLSEIIRVLTKNGYFILEQVGSSDFTAQELSPLYNLENEREKIIKSGLRIIYENQFYIKISPKKTIHRFIIITKKEQ